MSDNAQKVYDYMKSIAQTTTNLDEFQEHLKDVSMQVLSEVGENFEKEKENV